LECDIDFLLGRIEEFTHHDIYEIHVSKEQVIKEISELLVSPEFVRLLKEKLT
jgi:predicted transcriptional regulator